MVALSGLVILTVAWLGLIGRDETWRMIAGPADLGAVDFATLERRSTPNDSLDCPAGYCLGALSDFPDQTYDLAADRLAERFDEALSGEVELMRVDDHGDPLYRRYVQRSHMLRFPDTIDVRFLADGTLQDAAQRTVPGTSRIAIYSRSQLGSSDFGVNQDRIKRWLRALEGAMAGAS